MLRLSLGILCGLILILLPAALFPGPDYSPTTNTCSNCNGQGYILAEKSPIVAGPAASTINPFPSISILAILFLILLPSLAFSVLVRRWARRRAVTGELFFE